MENKTLSNRFNLRYRIGGGSFGEIYCAEDLLNHKMVALKLESNHLSAPQLEHEAHIYNCMEKGVNIPTYYYYGSDHHYNMMAIDLLGRSMEDILMTGSIAKSGTLQPTPFSLKTVLMLVEQMLQCIQFFHHRNYIHRDVKPDNFVIGINGSNNSNKLYIIDFGLAKQYRDPNTLKHIDYEDNKSLTGTARYASVNAMRGVEQSRRDDMESLGYVFVYLLKGKLPWQGLQARDNNQKLEKILNMKRKTSIDELCDGLPHQFADYLKMVRKLGFEDEPHYSEYRHMFRQLFINSGFSYDYKYDWLEPHLPVEPEPSTQQSKRKKPNARFQPRQPNQDHFYQRFSRRYNLNVNTNLNRNQNSRRDNVNQKVSPTQKNSFMLSTRTEGNRLRTALPNQRYHNNGGLTPRINRPQIPPRVYQSRRPIQLNEPD
ncbi:hypothetical protein M9Y10_033710 [Tritrichomonas musculus]|uniref:non-specific serine/threonine protein kinase n=1 Tax=Tritrichomonas musculus TaxID=1915356 RepID=A0ABR2KCW1_9EUKA